MSVVWSTFILTTPVISIDDDYGPKVTKSGYQVGNTASYFEGLRLEFWSWNRLLWLSYFVILLICARHAGIVPEIDWTYPLQFTIHSHCSWKASLNKERINKSVMCMKKIGIKWKGVILIYHPRVFLEGLRNSTKY